MTNEEMIRNIKNLAKKHENDKVYTFGVNYNLAFNDIANHIEELSKENDELKLEISRLTRIHANYVKSDFHEYCEMREYNDDLIVRNGMLRSENEELKLTVLAF